jgi:CDP-glycerol glycerophosphotransferase (TagB/SpsB family)
MEQLMERPGFGVGREGRWKPQGQYQAEGWKCKRWADVLQASSVNGSEKVGGEGFRAQGIDAWCCAWWTPSFA